MSAPDLGGPPLTAGIDIRTGSARPQKGRRDEIDDLISSYDANNDGRFSRDEVRRIIYDVRDLRKSNKLLKMAAVGLLLLCVMSLCSIFVVVLVGNEISKEESVNDEGELTSRATGSTVAVGRAESLSTLWDAPLLAPEAKAYLSELTAFVDMRGVSDVADWVEMTFKLGSAFQPLGSEGELQVYTVEGFRVRLSNSTRVATILMRDLSPTPLPLSDEEPEESRRARALREVRAAAACETEDGASPAVGGRAPTQGRGDDRVRTPECVLAAPPSATRLYSPSEWEQRLQEEADAAAMEEEDVAAQEGLATDADGRRLARRSRSSRRRSSVTYAASSTTVRASPVRTVSTTTLRSTNTVRSRTVIVSSRRPATTVILLDSRGRRYCPPGYYEYRYGIGLYECRRRPEPVHGWTVGVIISIVFISLICCCVCAGYFRHRWVEEHDIVEEDEIVTETVTTTTTTSAPGYPMCAQSYPSSAQSYPMSAQSYPSSVQSYPMSVQSYPASVQSYAQ